MFIVTRVLVLTQNVAYAMQIAQALEQPGAFRVTLLSSVEHLLNHLRAQPQDVLLLDINLTDQRTAAVVAQVYDIQPDLAIIALPDNDLSRRLYIELRLHGIIDYSWTARKLAPLLKEARQRVYEAQPGTARMRAVSDDEPTGRAAAVRPQPAPSPADDTPPVEVILQDTAGSTRLQVPGDVPPPEEIFEDADAAVSIFQKLAAEEPPLPAFEESATLRDLRQGMLESNAISRMMTAFNDEATQPIAPPPAATPDEAEDSGAIPAAVILANATDDSTPLDSFSLDEFLSRIQDQMLAGGQRLQPLPSWVEESERYVREPDFLPDDFALAPSQPLEYTAPATTPSPGQFLPADAAALETERSQPLPHSHPSAPGADDAPPPTVPPVLLPITPEPAPPEIDLLPELPDSEALELTAGTSGGVAAAPPRPQYIQMAPEDEAVARLALTLTQVSLELTAEACVLARDSQIIAYAGALPLEDIEEIRQTIAGDWEAAPAQGRIRFITLQGSGQDYMLYSRGVDGGFALSMIFSGTQQLHRIRRQGRRLADALAAVQEAAAPAAEAVPAAETAPAMPDEPAETGPLEPLTFLWLVRDPHFTLAAGTRQAVYHGLNDRLTRLGWQLYSLSVEEDHITLFADVPALKSPRERLQQLMERSADLVCRQHPEQDAAQLWAPSYLLLAPGRALRPEEIQDFLYFAGQS